MGGIGDAATEAASSATAVVRLSMMDEILVVVVCGWQAGKSLDEEEYLHVALYHAQLADRIIPTAEP